MSETGGILIVFDSEENEVEVSADDESIASNTPSTKIEDVWTRNENAQPTARALKTKNPLPDFPHSLNSHLTCKYFNGDKLIHIIDLGFLFFLKNFLEKV